MTLSSFLLAKSDIQVDNELDSLFKSAPKPVGRPAAPSVAVTTSKVAATSGKPKKSDDASSKKKRKIEAASTPTAGPSSSKKLKTEAAPKKKKKETPKAKSKKPVAQVEDSSEDEEDNSDIENQYLAGKQKRAAKPETDDVDEEGGESDADVDPAALVHESLQSGGKSKSRSGKQKYVPEDETPEKRDQRTVFVGNLPLAVASKRPLQKQLHKHILALVPDAKIESVRFRSVPFQTPTSKLPTSDDEDASSKPTKKPLPSQSKTFSSERPENHATKRGGAYKTKLAAADDDEVVKQDEKQFLTPAQKKKIAFIHGDFHNEADSVNAYVVFAHPVPKENWPKNLPPPKETVDPYEAAAMAVERCNNTVFMERVIRVDRVGQVAKGLAKVAAKEGEDAEGGVGALVDADPKFTVFVGNLDFGSKEEDLRVFFENLLVAEKGQREEEEEEEEKTRTWVVRVRIVRDKDTQLGKGFAYIQFSDKECVDEVLAMDEVKLKFAKRKLRVQRCKTLPGSSIKVKATGPKSKDDKDKKSTKTARGPPVPIIVPKGDPSLGERLAHLPKEVRKQAKAADGDRIARRLAKKKSRIAMGPGKDKVGEKEGARDRTRGAKGRKPVNTGKKTGKPRVRNEKNAERRNAKK
ncbi:hypothetical protein FA13DRAFT_1694751 [Coprinellus micaceus]|uniref:Nucleolar protein 12 n=1 Tax=Coprinellus micaceus TaxID=71717 RepID=A0A4Y7SMX9_COPMI|nr:hypothetical protein FA13DRAFT_1694751 [Coprinellus micaceus]